MIESFLNYAKQHNCSDIHIASDSVAMVRLDGDILPIPNCPVLTKSQVLEMLSSIMTEKQKKKFEENLEVDFAITSKNSQRFRVNAFHTVAGAAISLRMVSGKISTVEDLNLPQSIINLASHNKGLVLLVGSVGSGKSTTIAALIDYINTNYSCHIITIEDPVEFIHKDKKSLISQREIGLSTLTFDNALRSALRQDPDVIMIGEMRDVETIRFALTAAETGHLVFATLHTNSASQTINRIIDIFPQADKFLARTMLSTSLKAIVSQRLIKKVGGGRCAAHEILISTSAIRNLIREDQIHQIDSMISLGRKEGMCLMEESIKDLVAKGVVSADSLGE